MRDKSKRMPVISSDTRHSFRRRGGYLFLTATRWWSTHKKWNFASRFRGRCGETPNFRGESIW